MYSYYAATCQRRIMSHRAVKCILTMLQLVSDIFHDIEESHVFSLCCNMSGTFFVPINRNMYSHYTAACWWNFLSHRTEPCFISMLQHVKDIICPIEQIHIFSLCCSLSGTFLPHETETCILTILQHTGDIFLSTCILTAE